jgi:ferredoxin
MALTAQIVKEYARSVGADIVGIASMDRFEGAPLQSDPRQICPDARSMIVCGFRIPRGALRGIEEGTFYTAYCGMGYAGINHVLQPMVLWRITALLEDAGYEAMPIQNQFNWTNNSSGSEPNLNWSRPVAPGRAAPDVFVHLRIAAYCAGLGEIGYSKVFLTPEFGPRQRFAAILTDAVLEPDPLVEPGTICDRCLHCVRDCTGEAISTEETVKVKVAGVDLEWGKLDVARCGTYFCGGHEHHNPFMVTPEDKEGFQQEVSAAQRYKVGPIYDYGRALEGARGCIRACMIHLEQEGKLKNTFDQPFRRRPEWKLS